MCYDVALNDSQSSRVAIHGKRTFPPWTLPPRTFPPRTVPPKDISPVNFTRTFPPPTIPPPMTWCCVIIGACNCFASSDLWLNKCCNSCSNEISYLRTLIIVEAVWWQNVPLEYTWASRLLREAARHKRRRKDEQNSAQGNYCSNTKPAAR